MLSRDKRQDIKEILNRLAERKEVTLEERLYLNRLADKDPTVSNWLKRAKRIVNESVSTDHLDKLIKNLDIGNEDPNCDYDPENDDIEEWFKGAPCWLARS